MKKLTFIISILSICLMSNVVRAVDYYVDAINGNDSDLGTSAEPWQTINRAYTWYNGDGVKVQEGDTVFFRDGEYGEFRESTNENPGLNYLFYRSNWITYKAESGHNPVLTEIDILNSDKWNGRGDGFSYLIFDGFRILEGAAIHYASYITIRNCVITTKSAPHEGLYAPYMYPGSTGVSIRGAHYINVEQNDISNVYRGISVGFDSEDIIIKNNRIHRIGEDGISLSAKKIVVQENHIFDTEKYITCVNIYGNNLSGSFIEGEGVIMDGTQTEGICYRVVPRDTFDIVQVWQTTEHEFYGDRYADPVSNTLIGLTSGARLSDITQADPSHCDGIQIQGAGLNADIVVKGNIFHSGQWSAVKLAGPLSNVTVVNNLAYDLTIGIVTGDPNVSDIHVFNNTFYADLELYHNTVITDLYNNIIKTLKIRSLDNNYILNHGNNIFGNDPEGIGDPAHPFHLSENELRSYDIDSLFIDSASSDFRLKEGSAAVGFSDASYAPATDITGSYRDSRPDAGCYEYGASKLDPNPQPEPETNPDPELEDDAAHDIPDKTLLRISNNIIKSGGNSAVTINCDVKDTGNLTVKIYDSKGREIITLWNKHEEPRTVPITWTGLDSGGSKVGSGVYLVHMECGGYKETKKIAVIK